ncbi:hypothetical protein [Bosea sp. CRIB-10]|uniref:hypothetical protein n=1 Tax=Bosea sp. CRIB-10 TaxID=378404 RepID=UPI0011145ADF|nr:hypothetical protein [Bosea sp. CRIB-10]
MMRLRAIAVFLLLCAGATGAGAVERLTGQDIRQLFEGNTVAGRYSNGPPFSEYHHKDGRVTGHNRHVNNTDACWTTTEDAVCYYYGPHETRRTYCFWVERSGTLYVLRTYRSGRINGVATIQPGDSEKHAAKAPPWHCDGLISQHPGGARLAGR